MDAGIPDFFEWGFKIMATAGAALGFKSIFAAHKKAETVKDDLANFKLEVSEKYAKEATTQQSLGRIHDRIDSIHKDIKEILGKI